MQTALAKLYVAWPRASRADSVDAYVRRVIVNSHLDETRRPWRRESPTEDEPPRPGRADGRRSRGLRRPVGRAEGPRPQAAPGGRAPPLLGAVRRGDRRRPRRQSGHREEPDLRRPGAGSGPPSLAETDHPRRTAMTDPADRFLEEKLHALARGVSAPIVPTEDDVRRGRRRLFRMRVAMAGATTATLAVVLGVTSLTAGDPKATESARHPHAEHAAGGAEQHACRHGQHRRAPSWEISNRTRTAVLGMSRPAAPAASTPRAARRPRTPPMARPPAAPPRTTAPPPGRTAAPASRTGVRTRREAPSSDGHRRPRHRPRRPRRPRPGRRPRRPTVTRHDAARAADRRRRRVRVHQVLRYYNDVLAERSTPSATTSSPTTARSTTSRRRPRAAGCTPSARPTAGRTAARGPASRSRSPAAGTRSTGCAARPYADWDCHLAATARRRRPARRRRRSRPTTACARSRSSTPTARSWCSPPTRRTTRGARRRDLAAPRPTWSPPRPTTG